MTTYRRPKHYAQRDKNDHIIQDFLATLPVIKFTTYSHNDKPFKGTQSFPVYQYTGVELVVMDTSPFGGWMMDRLVSFGGYLFFVEIKNPGHEKKLQPGEDVVLNRTMVPAYIVTTTQEFIDLLGTIEAVDKFGG